MQKLEKYTGIKTYMFPTGKIATPEVIAKEYPATAAFPHYIMTDEYGEMSFGILSLSALRGQYNIDSNLSETDAIAEIEQILNTSQEVVAEPSPEERIAAALEFQNLLAL